MTTGWIVFWIVAVLVSILFGYMMRDCEYHEISRCHCQGLKIRGICQSCGFVVVCKSCNRTKQADGSFKNVPHASDNISHGLCEDCAVMLYPGIAHLAIARIRAREAN